MATEIAVLFVVEIETDNGNFAIRKRLAIFHLDARKFDRRSEFIDVSRLHVGYAKIAEHIFFAWAALQHEAAVAVFTVAPAALIAFCENKFRRQAFFKIKRKDRAFCAFILLIRREIRQFLTDQHGAA